MGKSTDCGARINVFWFVYVCISPHELSITWRQELDLKFLMPCIKQWLAHRSCWVSVCWKNAIWEVRKSTFKATAITFCLQYLISYILTGRRTVANQCACSVLCHSCATLPLRKMVQRSQNPSLHVSCSQHKLGIPVGFSCKQLCWKESHLGGLSHGTMPGLGQSCPSHSHFLKHHEFESWFRLCRCPRTQGRMV